MKKYITLALGAAIVLFNACTKPCGNHTTLYSVDTISANPMKVIYKDLNVRTNLTGTFANISDTLRFDSTYLRIAAPLSETPVASLWSELSPALYANTCTTPDPYPNAPLKKLDITADMALNTTRGNFTAGTSLVNLFDVIVKERYSDKLSRMSLTAFLDAEPYYTSELLLVPQDGVGLTAGFASVSFTIEYKKVDNSLLYAVSEPVTIYSGY